MCLKLKLSLLCTYVSNLSCVASMVSSWWSLLREYTNAKLKFCQWTFSWPKIQYYNTKSETFIDTAGPSVPLRTLRMKLIIHPMMHHFLHLIITNVNSFISSATYSDHRNNFRNQPWCDQFVVGFCLCECTWALSGHWSQVTSWTGLFGVSHFLYALKDDRKLLYYLYLNVLISLYITTWRNEWMKTFI